MRKYLLFASTIIFLTLATNDASASLISIDNQGAGTWNVLGDETNSIRKEIRVSETQGVSTFSSATLSFAREGESLQLLVETPSGTQKADVSNITGEIVEIEQKEQPEKIKILTKDSDFIISQRGVTAKTVFPIKIDSKNREFSLKTPSGYRYLEILPFEAVIYATNSNAITKTGQEDILINEASDGQLEYVIPGIRSISVGTLFTFDIPVVASVSASTGQLIAVSQPTWLKVFGFLFS